MTTLSPQCRHVLSLLQSGGATGVEAAAVYKVRHLPRRIKDLKEAGYAVVTEMRKDTTGQRYARYTLAQEHSA